MAPDDTAVPGILPEAAAIGVGKVSAPLPAGAAPEDVRHWFDLETIVELPAPVASFADAADAAAQYRRASRSENTRRAYRAAVARFTEWCAAHDQTALPASPETVAAFSRRRGALRSRRQHLAAAARGDPLPAPARRVPAADRRRRGLDDVCRHQARTPPAAQ